MIEYQYTLGDGTSVLITAGHPPFVVEYTIKEPDGLRILVQRLNLEGQPFKMVHEYELSPDDRFSIRFHAQRRFMGMVSPD